MTESIGEKLRTIFHSTLFSVPLGLLVCDIYLATRQGFDTKVLSELDLLLVWYETPFYLGHISQLFIRCLIILTITVVAVMLLMAIFMFKKQHHGTARWARKHEMARLKYFQPYDQISGSIFGKTTSPRRCGKYLTNGPQPHSLIVAPTRAGKGVGVVIPTLLTFNGSVLALDVKGELFELTSRARKARGDKIIKFAPMDKDGVTHCYNPVLDIAAIKPERRFSEARRLANNLIAAKGKGAEGFIDGARDLFVAGILACIERGEPTIGAVYDLFSQPGEKYKLFAGLAEASEIPEVQRIFDNMAGNDTKIITSYTSVLGDGGLNLWADPLIKNATSRSDFSIYDLRRDPTTIYLTVSPNDLEVIAPLVRLFFQQIVSILQREMPVKDEIFEVLFLLDEFKHLGKLEAIETAVTTIAGYNGRFMFIIQSLSALTGAYEQSGKENFLSNTGVQVFMATADDETPEYISKAVGEYTFTSKTKSYDSKAWWNTNVQVSQQGEKLLRPEQIRLIADDKQIVLVKGQPPLHIDKIKYYSDRRLKKIFNAQTGALPLPAPPSMFGPEAPMKNTDPLLRRDDAVDVQENDIEGLEYDDEDHEVLVDIDIREDENLTGKIADHQGELARQINLDAFMQRFDAANQKPAEDNEPAPGAPGGFEPDGLSEETHAMADQRLLLERIIALQTRDGSQYDAGDPTI